MNCPICKSGEHFVVRTDETDGEIKRRRQCRVCGHRWNTYEGAESLRAELEKLRAALRPVADLVR